MEVGQKHYRTVWFEGGVVAMIDQSALPHRFEIVRLADHHATAAAIADMTVRGAGAIGATAGFGMAQGFLEAPVSNPRDYVAEAAAAIRATRPTAQNLFYAVERVLASGSPDLEHGDLERARLEAVAEAQRIADEDVAACQRIGEFGASLIPSGAKVSTHCNAGWLAFVDWGSALAPIYVARRQGKDPFVWVDETRPRSQGAKLTAWELAQERVPYAILTDGAAASLMSRGEVDLAIVGSDRIAGNGDVANKIGTYPLALAAREARVPFYVAAPSSTIDEACASGDLIPIEERDQEEVLFVWGETSAGRLEKVGIAPEGAAARNLAFDVTPARLVKGIITEFGIFPASGEGMSEACAKREAAYRQAPFGVAVAGVASRRIRDGSVLSFGGDARRRDANQNHRQR